MRSGPLLAFSVCVACATPPPVVPSPPVEPPDAGVPAPAADPHARPSVYLWEGAETFGSRKLKAEEILAELTVPDAGVWVDFEDQAFWDGIIASKQRLLEKYKFAEARLNVAAYPPTRTAQLTVDLVDRGDEWRMRFLPAPGGAPPDPDGLIALWTEFQQKYATLRYQQRVIADDAEGVCEVQGGCVGYFGHPELAPYEAQLRERVPPQKAALIKVLREHKDEQARAAAASLLSFLPRGETVAALTRSIRDPSSMVRNEVLRSLGHAQHRAKRVIVPVVDLADALWFPVSTDRNKAGWALVRVVETDPRTHRTLILQRAGEALVMMAGMRQRIDREPALKILRALAPRDLGEDPERWRRWVETELSR